MIRDFDTWLGKLRYQYKVVVPGNHERIMAKQPELRKLIRHATVLINESANIGGLNIWGSPVTCDDNAFGFDGTLKRRTLYHSIPVKTDIVVTHGPPAGILDVGFEGGLHQGCPELLAAVQRVNPKMHVFGHVHGGYGRLKIGNTWFVNAALAGFEWDFDNPPVSIEIPVSTRTPIFKGTLLP